MPDLHAQVLAVLAEHRPENGVIVVHADDPGRVLATRDPAPGSGVYLTVLSAEPFEPPARRPGGDVYYEHLDRSEPAEDDWRGTE
jgi:hypothetical protein